MSSTDIPSQNSVNQNSHPLDQPQGTFFQRNWQRMSALLIWTIIGTSVWLYANQNNLGPVEVIQQLADLFRSPYGPLIYLAAYAIRPLIFFPATIITLAAGSIYGPILGVLYVVIASNTSAMIAYIVGRFFGEGILEEDDESSGLVQQYAKRMRQNSFETVMIMRFIFLPYDLVNYLSGFLRINWKAFLLATALGSIPGTIAFVLFGASLDISQGISNPEFNPITFGASLVMVVVSLVISRYFKRREGIEA